MNGKQCVRLLLASAGSLALAACGGGGTQVAAIPPPPPPAPPPAPVPPSLPSGRIGLQSAAPFKTVSADSKMNAATGAVQFSYSAADNRYTITLPGYQQGELVNSREGGSIGGNTSSTVSDVTVGMTEAKQPVSVMLEWPASSPYKYTNFGKWYSNDGNAANGYGFFAYGIPTAVGDMPLSGTATYGGNVAGLASNGVEVTGSVSLLFDFGAGTLSGEMKPELLTAWDPVPTLQPYVFRDTVYATGSTAFSGAFQVPGSTAPSSFQGSFTGQQGAELMANWSAPYQDPATQQLVTMVGVWIAKKP